MKLVAATADRPAFARGNRPESACRHWVESCRLSVVLPRCSCSARADRGRAGGAEAPSVDTRPGTHGSSNGPGWIGVGSVPTGGWYVWPRRSSAASLLRSAFSRGATRCQLMSSGSAAAVAWFRTCRCPGCRVYSKATPASTASIRAEMSCSVMRSPTTSFSRGRRTTASGHPGPRGLVSRRCRLRRLLGYVESGGHPSSPLTLEGSFTFDQDVIVLFTSFPDQIWGGPEAGDWSTLSADRRTLLLHLSAGLHVNQMMVVTTNAEPVRPRTRLAAPARHGAGGTGEGRAAAQAGESGHARPPIGPPSTTRRRLTTSRWRDRAEGRRRSRGAPLVLLGTGAGGRCRGSATDQEARPQAP